MASDTWGRLGLVTATGRVVAWKGPALPHWRWDKRDKKENRQALVALVAALLTARGRRGCPFKGCFHPRPRWAAVGWFRLEVERSHDTAVEDKCAVGFSAKPDLGCDEIDVGTAVKMLRLLSMRRALDYCTNIVGCTAVDYGFFIQTFVHSLWYSLGVQSRST